MWTSTRPHSSSPAPSSSTWCSTTTSRRATDRSSTSGDNKTGSGEGDDEQVLVDLSKVHGPVDTILFLVSSYQGHSLEWVANAYCRLVDDESDEELARFTLTQSVTDTGAVLALLRRSPSGWALDAVGEGVPITVPTQGLAQLNRFLS